MVQRPLGTEDRLQDVVGDLVVQARRDERQSAVRCGPSTATIQSAGAQHGLHQESFAGITRVGVEPFPSEFGGPPVHPVQLGGVEDGLQHPVDAGVPGMCGHPPERGIGDLAQLPVRDTLRRHQRP